MSEAKRKQITMLHATINSQDHRFPVGCTILKAARSIGIDIPTLRHDARDANVPAMRIEKLQ